MTFRSEFEAAGQEFGIFILIPAAVPWFNIVASQSVDPQYYYGPFTKAKALYLNIEY